MAKEQSTVKKAVKITAISLAALIGAFILIVLIYVIYVAAQYEKRTNAIDFRGRRVYGYFL